MVVVEHDRGMRIGAAIDAVRVEGVPPEFDAIARESAPAAVDSCEGVWVPFQDSLYSEAGTRAIVSAAIGLGIRAAHGALGEVGRLSECINERYGFASEHFLTRIKGLVHEPPSRENGYAIGLASLPDCDPNLRLATQAVGHVALTKLGPVGLGVVDPAFSRVECHAVASGFTTGARLSTRLIEDVSGVTMGSRPTADQVMAGMFATIKKMTTEPITKERT